MAYLVRKNNPPSPFWFAAWRDENGKLCNKSTKVRIVPDAVKDGFKETAKAAKLRALQIADRFEAASRGVKTVRELQNSIAELHPKGAAGDSVRVFLDRFLDSRRGVVAESSMRNEAFAVKLFLDFLGDKADAPVVEVTRGDALAFAHAQLARVRSGTVRQYVSRLVVPFSQAYDQELIQRNPFARLNLPRSAGKDTLDRQPFTVEEVKLLVERLPEEWSSAVRCCLWLGGLRLSDVALLRWDSIDFDIGVVCLKTKKTGEPMRIPIIPRLMLHLVAREQVGEYVHPLLAARYLKRGASSGLSDEFSAYVRALGIGVRCEGSGTKNGHTTKTFHCLRATAATLLHMAGVDQAVAMRVLSHNSEAIHRVYVRPSDEQVAQALGRLEDI